MSRLPPPWIGWTVAVAVIALILAPAALSASRAAHRATVATARLEQARHHAGTIAAARAARPTGSGDGLAEDAIAAITAAGLPTTALDALTPDAGSAGSGPVARRRATMSLRCTLPQAGKLMELWPRLVPGWTITAADISPIQTREPDAPGPLPLRVILTIEGVLAQEDGA